ncbi:MAG TPA: response regulator transcription factor [Pyrinomonadaceae bacterium]|nr:response regulator transcription factor [Pyrinomonadaceae bacterium]
MIKVLIADDHAIVRAGLRALINSEPAMELVGEATGGYEAIELVEKTHPDALVLDLSMPDLDGIAVTKKLKPQFPNLRILILTLHEDEAMLKAALKSGASGYILKRAAEAELISAIHVILRGDLYVDPSMIRTLLSTEAIPVSAQSGSTEALTPRETEVLKLIVQGYTNRQIGGELNISVRTAESHRANLSDKLGLHSRVELVRYAREHGLIE